ncbi:MAG TPA: amidohydrolase, partial [Ruminococcaceae bacterium]|nr:amidohydrolase [Oscillospiraceae bacterium]
PAVLRENGINFAICTDHPETPVQYLPLTAALAVRGGLSRGEALKAITINAAKIIGAENRIGSVEVGKDADFSLFRGDPLDLTVVPELVCVSGKIVEGVKPL